MGQFPKIRIGFRVGIGMTFPSLDVGTWGFFPTWFFDYPRAWSVGLACKSGQRSCGVGWGWAEGETVSFLPAYQMMPDPADGKTLTWAGFYVQHSV